MVADHTERGSKRSFWMHQIAEYVIGVALVATGVQSPTPLVPTVLGALVLVNAATADGPFGAFRRVSRRWHRVIDVVLLALSVLACLVPGVDSGVRVIMVLVVAVYAVVVVRTDYRPRATANRAPGHHDASPSSGRADRVGRVAGRVSGRAAGRIAARVRSSSNGGSSSERP